MSNNTVKLDSLPGPAVSALLRRRRRRLLLATGGALLAFLAWEASISFVFYTDDAYVRSDVVAVAPEVTGHIVAVHVSDNQAVRQGDQLVSIDPVPFQLVLDEREAQLREAAAVVAADQDAVTAAQAQAQAAAAAQTLAESNYQRIHALSSDQFASAAALDTATETLSRARADAGAAQAAIARAQQTTVMHQAVTACLQAEVATAQWRLDRTELRAPVGGIVSNLTLRVGDTATAGVPLIGMVDDHAWRIVANYKQDVIRRLQVGGAAWVWLDTHPWRFHRATIQGISRAISRTPDVPGLVPYVAPTTDWIRLQRRFPVTLVLVDPPQDLALYMGADARAVVLH